jgi:hypothetical protein
MESLSDYPIRPVQVGQRAQYYLANRDEFLKFICFFLLGLTSFFEVLDNPENTLWMDPFCIGAFIMALCSLITFFFYRKTKIDLTYPGMFIFILSKLISQYTHSKHLTIFGKVKPKVHLENHSLTI